MRKPIEIVTLLFIFSCGSSPDYQEVMVNRTVKVYSKEYHAEAENYTFKWEPPIGPIKKPIPFDLKNDMLIFTPNSEGDYQIHLSITDISNEVIAEELFYYRVVAETLEVAIAPQKPDEKSPHSSSIVKKPKPTLPPEIQKKTKSRPVQKVRKKAPVKKQAKDANYTIQVAAWPSLELARKDQLRLIEEGFDAYTQRFFRKEKDAIWYRVRIGNFSDKMKAQKMQKQIESIIGSKTWLDVISTEIN